MIFVYGISNCDTVKKALAWLKENKVPYGFHDFKASGINKDKLEGWIKSAGLEKVMNKNSTTWKNLPEETREKAMQKIVAIKLMQENTSIIKRPVIEFEGAVYFGFSREAFSKFI